MLLSTALQSSSLDYSCTLYIVLQFILIIIKKEAYTKTKSEANDSVNQTKPRIKFRPKYLLNNYAAK